jgi:hypothetical protein
VVIGAYNDATVHTAGGSVLLWWGPVASGTAHSRSTVDALLDAASADQLVGTAVALPGDLSGDGTPDLAVGASWNSDGASKGGQIVLID